jgi:hypothetical protein
VKQTVSNLKETVSGHKDKIVLPTKTVSLAPEFGFVYSGLKEELESCVEQVFSVYDLRAKFEVNYKGCTIMQFWMPNLLNEENKEVMHSIAIWFIPTRFKNADQVMERFKKCGFYDDFQINNNYFDNEYDVQQGTIASASYGMDIEKAMKVASYIISNVCYIPVDTQLDYTWWCFYNPILVSSILVKPTQGLTQVDTAPDMEFIYPCLEGSIQRFANEVFAVKGGNGQMVIHHQSENALLCGEDVYLYLNLSRCDAGNEQEKCISIAYACSSGQTRRFMRNHYIKDFTIVRKEEDGTMESAYAEYGQDVNKVSKIVSYILADVFRVPLDAELEYEDETNDVVEENK